MTNINVRVDEQLKSEADALFQELGLDTSTAIRVFLRQSVMYGGIPFELRRDHGADYVRRALDEADERRGEANLSAAEFEKKARARIDELFG